jgi:antitoxin (DNA-binding transcriptional repressor) of toxin-antitoxin stability system
MHTVDLAEAEKQLPQLIEEAAEGEDVIIRRPDGRTFRIVPTTEQRPRPTFGSARGKIRIGDDFDAPLKDFEGYRP